MDVTSRREFATILPEIECREIDPYQHAPDRFR
jgi:hypothetical protein